MKGNPYPAVLIVTFLLFSFAFQARAMLPQATAVENLDIFARASASISEAGVLWNRTYGGNEQDYTYSMTQSPDNGFALAGATYSSGAGDADFWLVKTDSGGVFQWSRTYGGTAYDEAHSITKAVGGGYAILGTTSSFGAGDYDFWLVRTDFSGNLLWNKTYGGVGTDDAWSILETSDSDLVLAGWTASFGTGAGDFWLIKTDPNGNMLWNKTYGGPSYDIANSERALQQTSDGGYILSGSTYSFGAGGSDFWLVKTDAFGNEQWNKTYGGAFADYGFSGVETPDGYALAGSTISYGAGVYDFWLVKTDEFGEPAWNKTYGGGGYDEAWSILRTSNNHFILAGWTESFGAGSSDSWLVETDEWGNMLWSFPWGGAGNDYSYSVLQCIDGNYVITGATESFGVGSTDSFLARVRSGLHDVGIININISKTVVGQGFPFNVSAGIINYGQQPEVLNIVIMANSTTIQTYSGTLDSWSSTTLTFACSTSDLVKGGYFISVSVASVPGETDMLDNTSMSPRIIVARMGDINADGKVNILDIVRIALTFGNDWSSDPNADINNDGRINILDLVIVAIHFGESAPP